MREQWSGRRGSRAVDQADPGGAAIQPGPPVEQGQEQESTRAGSGREHEDAEAAGAGKNHGAAETVGETGVLTQRAQQAIHLAAMMDQAQDYARLSRATNTQRAYRADWADFSCPDQRRAQPGNFEDRELHQCHPLGSDGRDDGDAHRRDLEQHHLP